MRVLPVYVYQLFCQFTQLRECHGDAIDKRAAFALFVYGAADEQHTIVTR